MSVLQILLRGVLIGLVFGVPVGAVGALTVQRSWTFGPKAGLLTGLGSSAADCAYACVGAFGLTLVSEFLVRWQHPITLLGGALVSALGVGSLLRPGQDTRGEAPPASPGGVRLFLTSFAIGITNPAAVLTFLLAFSTFGIAGLEGPVQGAALVAGVLVGTYLWWGTLTAAICLARRRAARLRMETVNRVFGVVLCLFGAGILLRTLVF